MSSQIVFKAPLSRCRQRASQSSNFENLSRYKQEAADEDLSILSSLPARDRKNEHALKLNDKGSNAYAPIELSDEDTDVPKVRARVMNAERAKQPVSLRSAREDPPKEGAATDEVCDYAFQGTNLDTIENTEASNVVELTMQGQEHPQLSIEPNQVSEDVYHLGIEDHAYSKLQVTSSIEEVEVGAQPAQAIEHNAVSEPAGDNVTAYRDNDLHCGKHEDFEDLFANQGSGSKLADKSTYRAPVAYMGPGPSDTRLNIIEPNRVGLVQEHVATRIAENVESTLIIEAPGDGEERLRKAQKTLSEMEEILCEHKDRKAHNVKKLSDSGKPSHVNQLNRGPFTNRPITHAGPSGLQTGAAALGLRNPEVLRERGFVAHGRNHRPSSEDEIMPSNLSFTNRKDLAKAANIRNAEGRRMHGSQEEIPAADLFLRGSVTPPAPASLGDIPARRKRPRGTGTIPEFFTAKKRTGASKASKMTVTLKEGYFERHEQRIKALKERAERENHEFEGRFDGQEQSLFLSSESDEDYQARSHPEAGGEGLSKENTKSLEIMESRGNKLQMYPTPSQSENDDLEMPKLLYEYHVTRRAQLEGQFDNQARTAAFGPFYTIAEANAVAANEARCPSEELAKVVFRPGAWSYSFDKDELGMETHIASGKGGTVYAWVTRNIAPPEQKISIPLRAFTTPAWVYVALVSSGKGYATNYNQQLTNENEVIRSQESPPETTIITSCTLLDLANRAAGRRWSELQAANIPNDGLGAIQKAEMDMRMRRDLDQMDKDNVAFDRTHRDPTSGIETHIWVEMIELEGPRN